MGIMEKEYFSILLEVMWCCAIFKAMIRLFFRMLRQVHCRLLYKFFFNFIWKGWRAANAFKKRHNAGDMFPAFIVFSATNACNLSCRGCWVAQTDPPEKLTPEEMDSIICDTKKRGSFFFGILGGEPLTYPEIFDVIEKHPDCYFQLFTNGTLITAENAERMRKLGNVTPLISIEGDEAVSDERRGGDNVYERTLAGVKRCHDAGLIIGIATSVCKSNIDDLVSERFVEKIVELGAHYLWYYIYRPTGEMPCPELALNEAEILRLRQFVVDMRVSAPIGIVDAYWDHDGKALCPGALGLSHHINAAGDVEFCPVIQFAKDNIRNFGSLSELFDNSSFLKEFREFTLSKTEGCILLEDPQAMREFLISQNADDVTGRNCGFDEVAAMKQLPGHFLPGKEIPEKSRLYRFAKKNFFFGFGGYG